MGGSTLLEYERSFVVEFKRNRCTGIKLCEHLGYTLRFPLPAEHLTLLEIGKQQIDAYVLCPAQKAVHAPLTDQLKGAGVEGNPAPRSLNYSGRLPGRGPGRIGKRRTRR